MLASDPGRCVVRAPCWYVAYTDHDGTAKKRKGYTSRAATEQLMAEIVRTVELVRAKVIPPEAAAPRLTLTELLDRWERTLAAAGTAKNARTERVRAGRIIEAVGATRAADLTPAAVTRALAAVRKARGLSAQTTGHHVKAVKGFTRWLHLGERAEPTDHLAGLRRKADETDPRHQRRALAADELARVVAAARASEDVIYGLTGPERAALYVVAASTGFRASELASLTVADISDLSATVRAAFAKNRRRDTIPLSDEAAAELAPLTAGKKPAAKVWPDRTGRAWNVWYNRAADMLRRDLAAAGIAYRDEQGRVADFHSLRATFITHLGLAGVPLTTAQKLARHSTPVLTANVYTKLGGDELRDAVNRLRK